MLIKPPSPPKKIIKTKESKNYNFKQVIKGVAASPVFSVIGPTIISGVLFLSMHNANPEIIFNNVSPSIVTISSYGIHRDPFEPKTTTKYLKGTGTGFSFGGIDYIVTNNHVIDDAFYIKITTQKNNEIEAEVVGKDEKHDIALLHITKPMSLPNLKKCANSPKVGQSVFAIGNPFGYDRSMSTGIISGLERTMEGEDKPPFFNLLQTDAAINPGNSGGPLLDASSGCVLGINTAIVSPSGASSGIGFAIPMDKVYDILEEIQGKIINPKVQLGITLLPDKFADILGIHGVILADTLPEGIAEKIGLIGTSRDDYGRPLLGDIIVGVGKEDIRKNTDLYRILDAIKSGDTIELKVLRKSGIESFEIKF